MISEKSLALVIYSELIQALNQCLYHIILTFNWLGSQVSKLIWHWNHVNYDIGFLGTWNNFEITFELNLMYFWNLQQRKHSWTKIIYIFLKAKPHGLLILETEGFILHVYNISKMSTYFYNSIVVSNFYQNLWYQFNLQKSVFTFPFWRIFYLFCENFLSLSFTQLVYSASSTNWIIGTVSNKSTANFY